MNSAREVFGQRLRTERERKKLTQEEFGKKFSLNKQYISYYETGKREPSIGLLKEFAIELNVTVDYLLGNSDFRNIQDEQLTNLNLFSEEAINKILSLPPEVIDFLLNKLMVNDSFLDLAVLMQYYSKCDSLIQPIEDINIIKLATGQSTIKLFNKRKLGFYISNIFESILDNPEATKKLSKEEAEKIFIGMLVNEGGVHSGINTEKV